MVLSFLHRNWQILAGQSAVPKADDALKFGILGAAAIAPTALLNPAKQHAEVIVQAVAARDKKKAEAYAKKHGIPQVFDSYQALLDDPSIDAVYIPLPNGAHYEWALKALAKGKHVLLEKPATSNAVEAERLFRSPVLLRTEPRPPVILEAFHYRFQPCWLYFMSFVDRPSIAHVYSRMQIPAVIFAKDDIRFNYELAGGALMDLTYTTSVVQTILGAEAEECLSCTAKTFAPPGDTRCDYQFDATWRFPGDVTAEMHGNLQASVLDVWREVARAVVTHKPVSVPDPDLPAGQEKLRTRTVMLDNFIAAAVWHRIVIEDEYVVRERGEGEGEGEGKVVKKWKTREVKKAYIMKEAGIDAPSEPYWFSYRYQLGEFVNRIRGRPTSKGWISEDESIGTMRMIDMAYAKAGLPLRPTSAFQLE